MENKHTNGEFKLVYPKVSIVTPSYNQAQFIERTIQSVLNQDYPNIEYLIIDGGSTDGSVEIIRKYEHRLAYWVSEPDRGQSHAMNKGFKRATGNILAWINSDDEYTHGAISNVVRAFSQYPDVGMIHGNCDVIDEYDNVKKHIESHECDLEQIIRGNIIAQPSAFFKKEVIEEVGLLDETLDYAMDYDLWLKICSKYRVKYLPLAIARFRHHLYSKTISQDEFFWQEMFIVFDNFLLNTPLQRTSYDDAYTNMLQLIVYWQKEQIETAVECIRSISDCKLFSYEDVQHLCAFFEGNALTPADLERVKTNLLLLYRNFYRRYIHGKKNVNVDKYAHQWIDKQMINAAHYLFNQGKSIESKRLFWILLKTDLNQLKDCLTYRLVFKYLLTSHGVNFMRKIKRLHNFS